MVVGRGCSQQGSLVLGLSGAWAGSDWDDGFRSEWVLAAGLSGI